MNELILMILYTVAVYNLRMYMMENDPSLKDFKGDNLFVVRVGLSFCDLTYGSSLC